MATFGAVSAAPCVARFARILSFLFASSVNTANALAATAAPSLALRRLLREDASGQAVLTMAGAGRRAITSVESADPNSTTFGFIDENIGGVPKRSELPWRPASQKASSETAASWNLCAEGKLLPQLYLLGAAKSATTSLAADLIGAGVEGVGRDCRLKGDACNAWRAPNPLAKEFHFFDFATSWGGLSPGGSQLANQRRQWLDVLPECPGAPTTVASPATRFNLTLRQLMPAPPPGRSTDSPSQASRRVLADFTPESLRLVPMPRGIKPFGFFAGSLNISRLLGNTEPAEQVNLPRTLRSFYGDQSSRVTFVVMLREPAARMQSHWYCCVCPQGRCGQHRSFQGDLTAAVAKATDPIQPQYSDWLWYSMYRHQIKTWTSRFNPSQFYVVPYRQFVDGNKDVICQELSNRLHLAMDCASHGANATWIGNPDTHPAVEKDLSPAALANFTSFMEREVDQLAMLLMRVHQRGTSLANYMGRAGSRGEVRSWLESGW